MRWAAKTDTTQQSIIDGLRALNYQVFQIKLPCDLLVRFWCHKHQTRCWQPLEVKTPRSKKAPKVHVDKRQVAQIQFLAETQTPVVMSLDEALNALRSH